MIPSMILKSLKSTAHIFWQTFLMHDAVTNAERSTDLDKLDFPMVVWFSILPQLPPKIQLNSKVNGQNQPKNNHLASLI